MTVYRTLDSHIPNIGESVFSIKFRNGKYRVYISKFENTIADTNKYYSASKAYSVADGLNNLLLTK